MLFRSLAGKQVDKVTGTNLYVESTFGDKALVVDNSGKTQVISIKDADVKPGQIIASSDGQFTTDTEKAAGVQDQANDLAKRTYNGKVYETEALAVAAKDADAKAKADDLAARTYNGTVYDTLALRNAAQQEAEATTARELAAAQKADRKSTRLNSSHVSESRMPSSA